MMMAKNDFEDIMFDLREVGQYFKELTERFFGATPKMKELENLMEPIREGKEELTIDHIKAIKDEEQKYWRFPWFWNIPEIKEIQLSKLNEALKNKKVRIKQLIKAFFDVFKNIEVVSCFLRFIDPKNFGIMSPPVENLIITRGKNHVEKYCNYLDDLRKLMNDYNFDRLTDVDMALWTLARILNSQELHFISPYSEIYNSYKNSYNPVKKIMAKNSLSNLIEEEPILLAELIFDSDYILSGSIAGRVLELSIKTLCKENQIKTKLKRYKDQVEFISFIGLMDKLKSKKVITEGESEELEFYWDIRNKCVHEDKKLPSEEEVSKMLITIKNFNKRHDIDIKCRYKTTNDSD